MVPHKCTNGSSLLNKWVAIALDKKCLKMACPPELLVQIKYYFSEMFLIMPSTKIAQMVWLN